MDMRFGTDGSWEYIMRRYGLDFSGSGEGQVEGSCESGNEPSGSVKCWEVLEQLLKWRPLEVLSSIELL
jgi:hypothetical protein